MTSISIRKAIPLLIVVPLVATVGLTGWITYQGGQQQVRGLTVRLLNEVEERITHQIKNYLQEVQVGNQTTFVAQQSQLLSLNDRSTLQRYFWNRLLQAKGMTNLAYGDEQGNYLGLQKMASGKTVVHIQEPLSGSKRKTYNLDDQGNRTNLADTINYDARQRPWYKEAAKTGKAGWSPIFASLTSKTLQIAAIAPIYSSDRKLQGVLTSYIELSQINDFLHTIKVSPHGDTLILEKSGELVASSVEYPVVTTEGKPQRLHISNSSDPIVREAAKLLFDLSGNFQLKRSGKSERIQNSELLSFFFKGEEYVMEVEPAQDGSGIDWLVVVIVPMSDFVAQLRSNALSSLAIGALIAGLFTLFGLAIAARWIIQPLQQLTKTAKTIEANEFDPASLQTVAARSDEIGQLAKILNEMAGVIFNREQSLQSRLFQIQDENKAAKKAASKGGQTEHQRIQQLLQQSQQLRTALFHRAPQAKTLLQTVTYFQALSDAELEQLFNAGYERTVQRGEIICQEGNTGDAFYIILAGAFEVYAGQPPKPIRHRCEGDFFGELALLLGMPRTATVKALEDSLLFVVDHNGLQALLQKHPQIAESIAYRIDEHKAELEKREEELKKAGLLEDSANFRQNSLLWIQQRMRSLFNIQFKQPV